MFYWALSCISSVVGGGTATEPAMLSSRYARTANLEGEKIRPKFRFSLEFRFSLKSSFFFRTEQCKMARRWALIFAHKKFIGVGRGVQKRGQAKNVIPTKYRSWTNVFMTFFKRRQGVFPERYTVQTTNKVYLRDAQTTKKINF